jgi:hypothetical protein
MTAFLHKTSEHFNIVHGLLAKEIPGNIQGTNGMADFGIRSDSADKWVNLPTLLYINRSPSRREKQ